MDVREVGRSSRLQRGLLLGAALGVVVVGVTWRYDAQASTPASDAVVLLASARRAPAPPALLSGPEVNSTLRQRLQRMRQREGGDIPRRLDAQRRRVPGPDTVPFRPPLPRDPNVILPSTIEP